jgi:1-phosphofructokinase family hexose kinase
MILTVTLNPAIDRTCFIKDFAWNRTIRASQSVVGMGGKATDASWVLGELGYANLALGFSAGATGRLMEKMLRQRGCKTDFVRVPGETRANIVIIGNEGKGQSTLAAPGLQISSRCLEQFRRKFSAALKRASCVVIGGSLPPGLDVSVYTALVKQARQAGLPVVFDASGPGLKAGMEGRPTVAKPNIDEIAELYGQAVTTNEEAYEAGRELQDKYGAALVITLGKEGALAVLQDRAYCIPVLQIPVVSTAGAGDAVLAGLATALSQGNPLEAGLRLGFAAAAAVCLTPATADCRRADVERFLPQIELVPYSGLRRD